jgi:S-(hydroxymethyl)glutathione dehydrogenase/alcohol dehydrogenase
MKAKAAILVKSHEPLVIDDIELPENLSFGQVLVEVRYTGICGAQINEIDAVKGPDKFLPHLLGHEGSGVVSEIGPGVKGMKKGDHVVMHWRKNDGIQCEPPSYRWNGQKVNAGWVTTFNDKAIVSENRLTVIPQDFDLSIAPLFGCAMTTALGVICNDANVKIGESVVVIGTGGVGLNIIQMAKLVSADSITAVDIHDDKLEMAKAFGASHGINSAKNADNLDAEIRRITGAAGADVVIETTGRSSLIEMAYNLAKPQGRTILVGVPKKGDNISIYSLPLHFKKILKGSEGGDSLPSVDIPKLIGAYQKNRIKMKEQITHRFPFEKINEAIDLMKQGKMGRCILSFS